MVLADVLENPSPLGAASFAVDDTLNQQAMAPDMPSLLANMPKSFNPIQDARMESFAAAQQQRALANAARVQQPFQLPQPTIAHSTPEGILQGLNSGIQSFQNVRQQQRNNALVQQQMEIGQASQQRMQDAIELSRQVEVAKAAEAQQQAQREQQAVIELAGQSGVNPAIATLNPNKFVDIAAPRTVPGFAEQQAFENEQQQVDLQGKRLGNRQAELTIQEKAFEIAQQPVLTKYDYAKKDYELANLAIDNQIKTTNLQYLPAEKQVQLQGQKLGNFLKQVEGLYAQDKEEESLRNSELSNQEKADKIAKQRAAMEVFTEFNKRLANGEAIDGKDLANVQANLQMLSGDVPEFAKIFRQLTGVKDGKPITEAHIKKLSKIDPPKPVAPPASSFNPSAPVQAPQPKQIELSRNPQTIEVPGGANVILQPRDTDLMQQEQQLLAQGAEMNRGMADLNNRGVEVMDNNIAAYQDLDRQADDAISMGEGMIADIDKQMDKIRALF